MYLDKKLFWESNPYLDPKLKEELLKMTDEEAKEAFTNDLEFGTAGIRGILGPGTNRMNYYVVRKATRGFGQYLAKFDNAFTKGVVIAHDNRNYSKEFALDSAKVLTKMGFKVYLFKDLRPTPELSFAVRHLGCIGGIMITASHNPKEYNGYKIYDETGCQTLPNEAAKVINEINSIGNYFEVELSDNLDNIIYLDEEIDNVYQQRVKEVILNENVNKDFKVVFTPLHGTGQVFACDLLANTGYNVFPYMPQMINDPNFSNVDSSNPEDEKAYTQAIEYAKEIDANLVLATDPDADRLGVVVKHDGEYKLLNGNQTAIIMVEYILRNLKEKNKLPENGYVFTTNVSSSLPLKIAEEYGMNTYVSLTGFKFIGEQAKLLEGKGTYVYGFEESYGCLIKDFVRDKDALQAILMLCEIYGYYNEQNKTLVDALNDIYEQYGYTTEGITSIYHPGMEGAKKIERIVNYFRNTELELKSIISKEDNLLQVKTFYNKDKITTQNIDLPKSNVIKYIFEDGTNFVVRPSGTEPKLKVYYNIIGKSSSDANKKLQSLKDTVLKMINTIE
ncbi:MAG: phospho-sugar mutase [bacterium]